MVLFNYVSLLFSPFAVASNFFHGCEKEKLFVSLISLHRQHTYMSGNTNIIATEEFSIWLFHCIVISREANIFHQLRQVDFLTGELCPSFYWFILIKFDLRGTCSFEEVMLVDGDCQTGS